VVAATTLMVVDSRLNRVAEAIVARSTFAGRNNDDGVSNDNSGGENQKLVPKIW